MSKQKQKANTVMVDHRNIVGIDIGKRKHAAAAVTPKGAVIASLKSFENNQAGVDLLEHQVRQPAKVSSELRWKQQDNTGMHCTTNCNGEDIPVLS
jgi:hypothetical protein